MSARITLLALLFAIVSASATAQTRFVQVEDCRVQIIVPIEFFIVPAGRVDEAAFAGTPQVDEDGDPVLDEDGDPIMEGATPAVAYDYADVFDLAAYAREIEGNAEILWNGPNAVEAEAVSGALGNEATEGQNWDDVIASSSGAIETQWGQLEREFGLDQTCGYAPCCQIEVDPRIFIRQMFPWVVRPGHHQIGIMGPDFRSIVHKKPNPELPEGTEPDEGNPDHWVFGDVLPTTGYWSHDTGTDSHEIGHLMGLYDQYEDDENEISHPFDDHAHDLMAGDDGFPFGGTLKNLVESHGMSCDCCPDDPSLTRLQWTLTRLIQESTDPIDECDLDRLHEIEQELVGMRRDLGNPSIPALVINASASRRDVGARTKAETAALIDWTLRRVREAIENCPEADEPSFRFHFGIGVDVFGGRDRNRPRRERRTRPDRD